MRLLPLLLLPFLATAAPAAGFADLGGGVPGTLGTPVLEGLGVPVGKLPGGWRVRRALPGTEAVVVVGVELLNAPLFGGTLVPAPAYLLKDFPDEDGEFSFQTLWPHLSVPIYVQAWIPDPEAPSGWAASNALAISPLDPRLCDSPGTCDALSPCGSVPGCFCQETLRQGPACVADFFCGIVQECGGDGICPPGSVCVATSCCEKTICVPYCDPSVFGSGREAPALYVDGAPGGVAIALRDGTPSTPGALVMAIGPTLAVVATPPTDAKGALDLSARWPAGVPADVALELWLPSVGHRVARSNTVTGALGF